MAKKKKNRGKKKQDDESKGPSKNEKAQEAKALEQKLTSRSTPKYLTEGKTVLDKDVSLESLFMYTPDGKIELLKNGRLQLVSGRRYGLIGKNGIGKTTLLRHISGYKFPGFPEYLRIMHCKQEVVGNDVPVMEYVLASDEERAYLEAEEERLLARLEDEGRDETVETAEMLNEELEKVYERLELCGKRTAEQKVNEILKGLNFTPEMMQGPTKHLSGGWRMRVSLACALFISPDILLLDEPTNHLDFPSLEWLESYLRNYQNTVVIVSHDRGFLNNTVTDIIDLHDQTLDYYRGDYDNYVKRRDEGLLHLEREYEKQVKEQVRLKEWIEQAKKSTNQATQNMVSTRQRMLDKMEEIEPPVRHKPFSFTFPRPGKLDHALVNCVNMDFGWDPNKPEDLLLKKVNVHIDMDSRVGVLGANGAGKSTFINLVMGKLTPLGGQLKLNDGCRVALFTQHSEEALPLDKTPLQAIQLLYPDAKEFKIRGYLGRFGFDVNLISHKIATLSGGQKSRIAFAILTWLEPHFIIMDEPTNHLDIETIEALINAVNQFPGGILLVSHDQYFVEKVAKEFWAVNPNGEVQTFEELELAKDWCYRKLTYNVLDGMAEDGEKRAKMAEAKRAKVLAKREESRRQEKDDRAAEESRLQVGKQSKVTYERETYTSVTGVDYAALILSDAESLESDSPYVPEDSEEEVEEVEEKQSKKSKKKKKDKKRQQEEEEEEEDEEERRRRKKEKKKKKKRREEDEGDEGDEGEEKKKKKKKKKKHRDEDEGDDEGDEDEERRRKKKKKKDKKKRREEEEDQEDEGDEGDVDEEEKKKQKKKKKKKKKLEEDDEDVEEEETKKSKKKKKRQAAQEDEVEEEESDKKKDDGGSKKQKKKKKKNKKQLEEEEWEQVEAVGEEEEASKKSKKKKKKKDRQQDEDEEPKKNKKSKKSKKRQTEEDEE